MKEMERLTEEFVSEINELMEMIMRNCTIKSIANMGKDEVAMLHTGLKLVQTSSDLLVNYQKVTDEMNSKLDIITKLLVEKKENEGQK